MHISGFVKFDSLLYSYNFKTLFKLPDIFTELNTSYK